MDLRGQAGSSEHGYAMAALLVSLAVTSVVMTVAMPVWKQNAIREKEAELVFRGEQYARAVGLFQRKYANAYPPSIDVLVDQRFLRKKYKDPIANDDFVPLRQGQAAATPGSGSQTAARPGQTATQRGVGSPATPGAPTAVATGGIIGVTSKSTDKSIRIYKGRNHYNEWAFVYIPQVQAPGGPGGAGVPGAGGAGQRGNRGSQPPGTNPFGPGGTPGRGRGDGRGDGRGQPGPRGTNPFGPGGITPFPIGPGRGR